jgi:hypothetical protein
MSLSEGPAHQHAEFMPPIADATIVVGGPEPFCGGIWHFRDGSKDVLSQPIKRTIRTIFSYPKD